MLLTLATTHVPATDLGYLLHKHPDKAQTFSLPFGEAHVFYPEAGEARCTAALLLAVDPVRLTRRGGAPSFALQPYVNDRPYATSSLISVALARVFGSALGGRCNAKPELTETPLPLEAKLTSLPCRSDKGGGALLERLFGPLGYTVRAEPYPLDAAFPSWGESAYYSVTLSGTLTLAELLRHLYVLIPVLDDDKHYWIEEDEVDNLLAKGEGWLERHPERELITRRYLKHQRGLAASALASLTDEEPEPATKIDGTSTLRLHDERLNWVRDRLKESGARRVLDLGCGEGKLLKLLVQEPQFAHIAGMDVSTRSLAKAARWLGSSPSKERVNLFQSSLLYRDSRLTGFDAAAIVEVVEHLEPFQLTAFEANVFGHARPETVILTTPNRDYNVRFGMDEGTFRHPDHRFEWTRAEFRAWAQGVATRYSYKLHLGAISTDVLLKDEVGAPTQVGVFRLENVEDERERLEVSP